MSLLVINGRASGSGDGRLASVSLKIIELIRRARFLQLPIAHVHEAHSGAATRLQVPIGRYDPVFKASSLDGQLPSGLIEFIVRSPSRTIDLVGATSQTQLDQLCRVLRDAGFKPRIEPSMMVAFEEL